MAIFKYKAINSEGQRIEGSQSADSESQIREMLLSNQYYPLSIEKENSKSKKSFSFNSKVKLKDIAVFCRQFYVMLDSGLSIGKALNILIEQCEKPKLREALIGVNGELKRGETLASSMRKRKDVFPNLLTSMIDAGERSGNLDIILKRMAEYYEKETKIRGKIKSAMIYPIVLGVVAIIAITFILTFVMPTFVQMFEENNVDLPMATKMVLGTSKMLGKYGIIIFLILVTAIILLVKYLKSEEGQYKLSSINLKIPVIKKLTQKIIVSRFTRTMGIVSSSGMSLVTSIEIVASVVGNKIAEKELLKVKEKVLKGEGLGDSIMNIKIFPPMLASMVKIGEEAGSLDSILDKTADFYDDELEREIKTATALIEPSMIVLMGIIIGFLLISILTPMFKMYNSIS
ncbi:type II secretion system F family protein [Clostridium perfringens]|uniref:Type II secretion system F family protein n=3 Tax=Clostridium perfringens TaxID=1502 RepID=A0AAP5SP70_CLOPF|nr:type II secretion system F family protein [Clostridium perfringens]ABG84325.1 bacterial type II secretion system protein F [Clostridium perfringens ATCC 13124]ATD47606.1 type II secretion system protein F [Clostridium perfringens]EDT22577.1 bacterial type II secretion system protein F [Clostridium perfringens B str. ATCC 3626]EIF5084699.1 type II secretion system F family protein [Clostridium perfringens]MBI5986448.1 type II secretion system F family protein [Clostridium perfringens]